MKITFLNYPPFCCWRWCAFSKAWTNICRNVSCFIPSISLRMLAFNYWIVRRLLRYAISFKHTHINKCGTVKSGERDCRLNSEFSEIILLPKICPNSSFVRLGVWAIVPSCCRHTFCMAKTVGRTKFSSISWCLSPVMFRCTRLILPCDIIERDLQYVANHLQTPGINEVSFAYIVAFWPQNNEFTLFAFEQFIVFFPCKYYYFITLPCREFLYNWFPRITLNNLKSIKKY